MYLILKLVLNRKNILKVREDPPQEDNYIKIGALFFYYYGLKIFSTESFGSCSLYNGEGHWLIAQIKHITTFYTLREEFCTINS